MTCLSDLRNLQNHLFANTKPGPDRTGEEVGTLYGQVLSKISRHERSCLCFHLLYTLNTEKAHLPVCICTGMSILINPISLNNPDTLLRGFAGALLLACAHSYYSCLLGFVAHVLLTPFQVNGNN
jgi:hypothetical protein